MKNIAVAAIIAAATFCSPVVLVTSSSALAVDCTNPSDPGNRPGGYCSLLKPGTSLSTPVTGNGDCSIFDDADASKYIRLDYGTSVLVACTSYEIPEACRNRVN